MNFDALLLILCDIFDDGFVSPQTTFDELGSTVYDEQEISFNVEELYDVNVTAKDWKSISTVQDLCDLIEERAK